MARIRSIKPEFWTDEKIVELSPWARLLFIGLWNFADDDGRMVYSPKRAKMQIFPADLVEVSELIGELRRENLVRIYTVDSVEYLEIPGFSRHQKIDRRTASKLPPPPELDEDSTSPAELPRTPPTEGKGREGIGGEGKGKEVGGADAPTAYAWEGRVIRLTQPDFDKWRQAYAAIPDFLAELQAADDYYAENPPDGGRWFFPVSRWLKKENERAKETGPPLRVVNSRGGTW